MVVCHARGARSGGARRHRPRGRRRLDRRTQAERLKVAVDTNVLVSAVIADGPPRRVLEAIRDGDLDLILPKPTVEELERVLREKLQVDADSIKSIVALLREVASEVVEPPADVIERSGDPADDRIIAAALAGGAEVLVSGDRKHVLPLGHVGTMRIVRPQDILAELAG